MLVFINYTTVITFTFLDMCNAASSEMRLL